MTIIDASDPASVYRNTNGVPRLQTGEVTHLNVKEGQGIQFDSWFHELKSVL